jgi:type III restriction enzyme
MDLIDKPLQSLLSNELGSRNILSLPIPEYIEANLNPKLKLRPYQEQAFQYFLAFMEEEHSCLMNPINLLFHMATGSGKTLIMAGLILYLYNKGYRNFLFFVNATNIIKKTEDNFINSASQKYLFADRIMFDNREVKIKKVENFDSCNTDDINIHFTTIQGLHSSLNNITENRLSYADFEEKNIVLIADEAHHINAETKKALPLKKNYLLRVGKEV